MTSIIVMVLTVLVLAAVCTWLWLMDVVDRRAARRVAELEYLLSSKPLQPRPLPKRKPYDPRTGE